MKKIFIILFILSTIKLFGQNFPGKNVELLLNRELKVLPVNEKLQKYGFRNFYTDENLKKLYSSSDKISTKYEDLVNKVFKVLEIKEYIDIIGRQKYKLKIENSEIGILYFDYETKYSFEFPFEVIGKLVIPQDYYCKEIIVKYDKFNNDSTFITEPFGGFTLTKIKKGKNSNIYISKNTPGSTLNVGAKGVIMLLENNKRIEKSNIDLDVKISPSKYNSGYVYNAFFELSEEDIKLLLENRITDTRLYIHDDSTKEDDAVKFIGYLKCLIDK